LNFPKDSPSEFQPGETADIIHIVPFLVIQRIIVLETNLNPGGKAPLGQYGFAGVVGGIQIPAALRR